MDPTKVKAFVNWPKSTNITKVQTFLSMVGYYRRFVEGFSKLSLSLTKLLCKDSKFTWTQECETSFQELKQRLVLAPILTIPEGNEGFKVYSDASRQGLGCLLMQKDRVVAYASRQLKIFSRSSNLYYFLVLFFFFILKK